MSGYSIPKRICIFLVNILLHDKYDFPTPYKNRMGNEFDSFHLPASSVKISNDRYYVYIVNILYFVWNLATTAVNDNILCKICKLSKVLMCAHAVVTCCVVLF